MADVEVAVENVENTTVEESVESIVHDSVDEPTDAPAEEGQAFDGPAEAPAEEFQGEFEGEFEVDESGSGGRGRGRGRGGRGRGRGGRGGGESGNGEERRLPPFDIDNPPEKVAQPDEKVMQQKTVELEAEIEKLKARAVVISQLVDQKIEHRNQARSGRDGLFAKLKEVRAERDSYNGKRASLVKEIEELETRFRAESDHQLKLRRSLKFKTTEEIDRKIAEVEKRMSTESQSLRDEKDCLAEIKNLKAQKLDVVAVQNRASVFDDIKKKLDFLRDDRKELIAVIESVRARENEIKAQLDALGSREDSKKDDEEINALIAERKAGLVRSREIRDTVNKERRAYEDQLRKHNRWLAFQRFVRRVQAEKRRQEREEEDARRRAEEEAEEAKLDPWAEEKALCDVLTRYLQNLLPRGQSTEEKPAQEKSDFRREDPDAGKLKVLKQEDDDGDLFGSARKEMLASKKGPKKPAAAAPAPKVIKLVHTPNVFALFQSMGLEAPLSLTDAAKTLEAVKAKRAHLDTNPPKPKKEKKNDSIPPAIQEEKSEEEAATETQSSETSETQPVESEAETATV